MGTIISHSLPLEDIHSAVFPISTYAMFLTSRSRSQVIGFSGTLNGYRKPLASRGLILTCLYVFDMFPADLHRYSNQMGAHWLFSSP